MALPLVAVMATGDPATAAWVAAVGITADCLSEIPGGTLVDRYGPRKVILSALRIRIALLVLIAIPAVLLQASVWVLALVAVLLAGTTPAREVASLTAISMIVPLAERDTAAAYTQARYTAASALGPPAGGALVGVANAAPLLCDALTALCAWGMARFLPQGLYRAPDDAQQSTTWKHTLRYMTGDRHLFLMVGVFTWTNIAFRLVWLLIMAITAVEVAGASSLAVGLVLSALSIGTLVGAFVAPVVLRQVHPRSALLISLWGWVAVTAPLWAVTGSPMILAVVWGGVGVFSALFNVQLFAYVSRSVPAPLAGKVHSFIRLSSGLALPAGLLLGGALVKIAGPDSLGGITVLLLLAPAVLITMMSYLLRRPSQTLEVSP